MQAFNRDQPDLLIDLIGGFNYRIEGEPTLFGYITPELFEKVKDDLEANGLTPFQIDPDKVIGPMVRNGKQFYQGNSIVSDVEPFALARGNEFWYGVDKNSHIVFFVPRKEYWPGKYDNFDISSLLKEKEE